MPGRLMDAPEAIDSLGPEFACCILEATGRSSLVGGSDLAKLLAAT